MPYAPEGKIWIKFIIAVVVVVVVVVVVIPFISILVY
jgi:hypothetical protein